MVLRIFSGWIALTLLAGVPGVDAQQAKDSSAIHAFTLSQAIDFALKNNITVKNASLDEQIAHLKVKETGAIGMPQVNGSFGVNDFLSIPWTVMPVKGNPFFSSVPDSMKARLGTYQAFQMGTQYNSTAGVDVTQLAFSSDYIIGIMSSKTYIGLTEKASARTRIETAVAVSKAYYTGLVNKERLRLLNANMDKISQLRNDTKLMYENGFVEKVDYDRIDLAYQNLQTEKEKILRLMDLSIALLKFQVGMEQKDSLSLTDKLSDIHFQTDSVSATGNEQSRVEYGIFQDRLTLAKFQLKRDKLAYLPNLAFFWSFSYNAYRSKFDFYDTQQRWYPTSILGAKMNFPIFSSGSKHYKVQQSKLSLIKAENDVQMIHQSISLETASAATNLRNAARSLESQQKNIELAEEVYRVSKLKYDQGVGSNLEVLNAETSLKEAQTNYYSALFEALIARVDYDKASGKLK